ncbi:XisH family protein [Merismopedia glauca]|uniref:Fatty-acid oxidation protein subunit alpha n=1 Tax=Merismopedia glauca CCAP 1448/3 TaxID=1296344 RepID=A0A2T1CAG3_9CYAN|nr:XisH family protein [Merismopedia glauca]PSB05266.1 fatty-acid oxidation protein subunit alpha [Merismopedia glauca CCAP 1448/3]
MPAKDLFHNAVRCGLEKEGWRITNDPLHLRVGKIDMYVDLGAEKVLAAEKGNRKIAVEIKSFLRTSTITEFYLALGQFIPYQIALEELEPDRVLYLAIPEDVYELFFQQAFIQKVVTRQQVKLIVYNSDRQEIRQWIN